MLRLEAWAEEVGEPLAGELSWASLSPCSPERLRLGSSEQAQWSSQDGPRLDRSAQESSSQQAGVRASHGLCVNYAHLSTRGDWPVVTA